MLKQLIFEFKIVIIKPLDAIAAPTVPHSVNQIRLNRLPPKLRAYNIDVNAHAEYPQGL
jgi:hypothetical protein